MPADKSKIAKNAIMLYIRMGVVTLVAIYTSRVILQNLGVSDYGTYNVVGGIITLLGFITGALGQGIQRFYNYYKGQGDSETLNKFFSAACLIMLGVSVGVVLLGETAGLWFLNAKLNIPADRLVAANWVFQCSIITTVMTLIASPYAALINAHEDFGIYAYLSIYTVITSLVVALLVRFAPIDKLIFYAILISLVNISGSLLNVFVVKWKYKNVKFVFHRERNIFLSLLSFSGWNMLGTASWIAVTTGMNIVLNMYFGTVVNAARGIAIQISGKVDQFVQNIQSAAVPQIIQLYANKEYEAVQSLVDDSFRWNFSLFWLMTLPIMLEVDFILKIWLGSVPEYTAIFTIIILIRSLLKCFEAPINTLNAAVGRIRYLNVFSSACTFLAFFLSIVLFHLGYSPYWGFIIDVIGILVVISNSIIFAHCQGSYRVFRFARKILLPVIIVIIVSGFSSVYFMSFFKPGIIRFLSTAVFSTVVSLFSLFFILYTADNRRKVFEMLKNKVGH